MNKRDYQVTVTRVYNSDDCVANVECVVLQLSCSQSLVKLVNTMHQVSATTTFEELQLPATSITDVVGNLLHVSIFSLNVCLEALCLAF